jgi:hypothetical protein
MIKTCTDKNGTENSILKGTIEKANGIFRKSNETTPKTSEKSPTKVTFHDSNVDIRREPMDLSDVELLSEEKNKSSRKRSKISKFFDSLRLPLNGNTDKEVNHKVSKEETQTDPPQTTRDHQDRTSNETLRSKKLYVVPSAKNISIDPKIYQSPRKGKFAVKV